MVSEAMLPRAAVREVEQRLTAAGCPDADFDARELFRLATGRDVHAVKTRVWVEMTNAKTH